MPSTSFITTMKATCTSTRRRPLAASPSSWPGYDLTIGSTGQKVYQLQEQLNRIRQNYPALPYVNPDGIYGQQTANAVRAFQQVFDLPATGITDYPTWYRNFQNLCGGLPDPAEPY